VCGMNVKECDASSIKSCNSGYSLVNSACIPCPIGASACSNTFTAT